MTSWRSTTFFPLHYPGVTAKAAYIWPFADMLTFPKPQSKLARCNPSSVADDAVYIQLMNSQHVFLLRRTILEQEKTIATLEKSIVDKDGKYRMLEEGYKAKIEEMIKENNQANSQLLIIDRELADAKRRLAEKETQMAKQVAEWKGIETELRAKVESLLGEVLYYVRRVRAKLLKQFLDGKTSSWAS